MAWHQETFCDCWLTDWPIGCNASTPGIPAHFPVFSLFHALKEEWDSKQGLSVVRGETRAPGPLVDRVLEGRESGLSSRFVLPAKLTDQLMHQTPAWNSCFSSVPLLKASWRIFLFCNLGESLTLPVEQPLQVLISLCVIFLLPK